MSNCRWISLLPPSPVSHRQQSLSVHSTCFCIGDPQYSGAESSAIKQIHHIMPFSQLIVHHLKAVFLRVYFAPSHTATRLLLNLTLQSLSHFVSLPVFTHLFLCQHCPSLLLRGGFKKNHTRTMQFLEEWKQMPQVCCR